MSYRGTWTSVEKVAELVQLTIDDHSIPKQASVHDWIEQIESRVVERRLGSHSVAAEYIDVPIQADVDWDYYTLYYNVRNDKLRLSAISAGVLVPLGKVKSPVISITKLYKNDEDPEDVPVWDELTEWDGTKASHFMLLTSTVKGLGYALWFYDEEPEAGPKRLKMQYAFGFNIDEDIIVDWCTLHVGIKILTIRMGSNEPSGISIMEGDELGTFVTTNYEQRIAEYRRQIADIEERYFPPREQEKGLVMEIL